MSIQPTEMTFDITSMLHKERTKSLLKKLKNNLNQSKTSQTLLLPKTIGRKRQFSFKIKKERNHSHMAITNLSHHNPSFTTSGIKLREESINQKDMKKLKKLESLFTELYSKNSKTINQELYRIISSVVNTKTNQCESSIDQSPIVNKTIGKRNQCRIIDESYTSDNVQRIQDLSNKMSDIINETKKMKDIISTKHRNHRLNTDNKSMKSYMTDLSILSNDKRSCHQKNMSNNDHQYIPTKVKPIKDYDILPDVELSYIKHINQTKMTNKKFIFKESIQNNKTKNQTLSKVHSQYLTDVYHQKIVTEENKGNI